jgi:hypothetical protein
VLKQPDTQAAPTSIPRPSASIPSPARSARRTSISAAINYETNLVNYDEALTEKLNPGPHQLVELPGAPPRLQEGRAEPASLAARLRSRKTAVITVTLAVSIATYWRSREAVGEMAARSLSIIIIAAAFWAREVLPLFATAFGVVGLEILAIPPNAMVRAGGLMPLVCLILTLLGYWLALPLVF